jgi:hypothetical protein
MLTRHTECIHVHVRISAHEKHNERNTSKTMCSQDTHTYIHTYIHTYMYASARTHSGIGGASAKQRIDSTVASRALCPWLGARHAEGRCQGVQEENHRRGMHVCVCVSMWWEHVIFIQELDMLSRGMVSRCNIYIYIYIYGKEIID